MRRRREIFILNGSTVLTAIVFYFLLIDAKNLANTQTTTEMFVNPTETLDNTGLNGIHSDDDNELSGDAKTSTHTPMAMTLQATPTSTYSIENGNRLFVATDGVVQQQHQFIVPNESMVTSNNGSTINITSSYSISNKSSMILSHDNNRNSSNTSYSSIKFTTMKPLIVPTLPEFTRHRLSGQKQYQSKHHHDRHFGPFFEDPLNTSGTLQLEFHEGTESILNCRVGMLKDKTVMWVRRTVDKVSLLTVGNVTYSGDPRIKVSFIYPNNWRLSINPINSDDGGLYMCQVSTHPPRVFATNLTVLGMCHNQVELSANSAFSISHFSHAYTEPAVRLVDELGHAVSDRYYKLGSSVDITCQVALSFLNTLPSSTSTNPNPSDNFQISLTTTTSTTTVFPFIDTNLIRRNYDHHIPYSGNHYIKWLKDGKNLPKDIKINLSTSHAWRNSRISIIHAQKEHSGTYVCTVENSTVSSSVNIHILLGERPEAVQHNHSSKVQVHRMKIFIILVGMMLIFCPNLYISEL